MAVTHIITGAEALAGAAPLFSHWPETPVWSALEGEMGRFWTLEGVQTPKAALCENADLLFLCGDAADPETRLLLEGWKQTHAGQYIILIPSADGCAGLIEDVFARQARLTRRFAFHKGGEAFDTEALAALAARLPGGVQLRRFDAQLYARALEAEWSRDFCSHFHSAQHYLQRGLGVAAMQGDELIAGASSYTRYSGGIEIQVSTRADWQRRGLAAACSAALILDCLRQGLYPSWDAGNPTSLRLAKRLGYREAGPYAAWELYPQKENGL